MHSREKERDSKAATNSTSADGISSELLINVIRTLTSTVSDDQRQLERERIEHGYEQSEKNIDKLLREHRSDVMQCLSTFQSVSRSLTNSREQIRNVKNSLSLCKTFLQCRRDDLNKFWLENAQQKNVCDILRQIQQIKEIDKTIDNQLANGEYQELIKVLKNADLLLKGPLDKIEGVSQLKFIVSDNLKKFFGHIVQELLLMIFVEPFELQMLELVKNGKVRDSKMGTALLEKYPKKKLAQFDELSQRKRLAKLLQPLTVFNQMDSALDEAYNRMGNLFFRLANETAKMIQLNANMAGDGGGGITQQMDSAHLAQYVHVLISQLNGCSRQQALLSAELQHLAHTPKSPILRRFWTIAQEGLEEILSEHLQVWRNKKRGEEDGGGSSQRKLFSFENASFVSSVNASSRKKQIQLVCPADIYNVVAIFHKLNVFCREVENQLGEDCCQIGIFLHTFVAEAFFEQIRIDLERKTEQALSGAEIWNDLVEVPGHNAKVLSSCVQIFELCEQINNYIINMEQYSLRFASFWLLILEHFIKGISDKYFQITMLRQAQGDSMVEYPKLSAAWVVDEDISRLLKSLPSWTAVKDSLFSPATDQIQTPFVGSNFAASMVESEQEIRERTKRESEILIGNLGTQKQVKKAELITDVEHIRILACLHETLQWFIGRMRAMIAALPPRAQELVKSRIQISTTDGALVEQMLCDAISDRIGTLEKLSDSILLILHLELRFHCFYHLLPITQDQSALSMLSQEELDRDVMEFGRDLTQNLYGTLQAHLTSGKLKYLFDGLAYLCSSIFIHSCQYINKLSELGRKRICRAIFTVQKYLSQLSGRPETEMQRAQMFFDFLNKELDQLFTTIVERGAVFSFVEYSILLALLIRSHPILNSQPGALESATKQLREILTQRANQQQQQQQQKQ